MKAQKETHIHKFNIPVTEEIILTQGRKSAKDTLKQWACSCGLRVTYDMEREIK